MGYGVNQKSAVVPSSGGPSSALSGQSAGVISQNWHSLGLGTRLASICEDRRRMRPPRFWTNLPSTASGRNVDHVVWVGHLADDAQPPVAFQVRGERAYM